MRSLRSIRLVAMREILERGRSRGYLLSLVFTLLLLGAGFILPSLLLGDQASKIGLVEPAPAGLADAVQAAADAYDVDVVVSSLPDREAAEAAVRDDQVAAALVVPADLSGPGRADRHQSASSELQAIANAR